MGPGSRGRWARARRALAVPVVVLVVVLGGVVGAGAAEAGPGEDVLRGGETLGPGQALLAPSGTQTLVVQPDGALGLYGLDGVVRWTTGDGTPGSHLSATPDGDVVLVDPGGAVLWSTATASPGAELRVLDDGDVVVVDARGAVLWSAGTVVLPSTLRAPARLGPGQSLASPDGRHSLLVDDDGTLVLVGADGRARWTVPARGAGAGLEVRTDGDAVLADAADAVLWRTGTAGSGATGLTLQDDGNLVLVRDDGSVVWSSGTPVGPDRLEPGGAMAAPASLGSPSGHVRVVVLGGRLVVLRDGVQVWASDQEAAGSQLRLLDDGDLVLVDDAGTPVWGVPSGPGAVLVVEDQAVQLLAADGTTPWKVDVPEPPEPEVGAGVVPASCDDVAGPVAREETVLTDAGVRVHACLAEAFDAMVAAAAQDGVQLAGGGWRSAGEQAALRRAHCGTSPEAVFEVPAGACSPPTARPGTSRHERGLAVDVTQGGRALRSTSTGYAWLVEHAHDYGLENLPGEPWHWSVDGS